MVAAVVWPDSGLMVALQVPQWGSALESWEVEGPLLFLEQGPSLSPASESHPVSMEGELFSHWMPQS